MALPNRYPPVVTMVAQRTAPAALRRMNFPDGMALVPSMNGIMLRRP